MNILFSRAGKPVLAFLLIGILCIPPPVAGSNENGDGYASGRGEYEQAAPIVLELKGSGSSYSNSSFSFKLPTNSTILSASVVLNGRSVVVPGPGQTLDFSQPDAANHFAYKGSYGQNSPGNSAPATFSGTQVPSSDRSLISASDNKYALVSVFGYPSPYGYHMFKFKVPFNDLAKATVTSILKDGFGIVK